MKVILVILLATIFFSCGNNSNVNLPDISDANIVKLYFKSDFDKDGKQHIITKEINDAGNVKAVKDLTEADEFAYLYCTSTGSIGFYKNDSLLATMVFNTDEGQRHIACNFNGKVQAVKLSDENAAFIQQFKNMTEDITGK